ncbi:MAG: FHA domain-containing protein [Thermoanaerobaculia bacterium]|nr:FHA domain-containing protein [Thermoanaerobaculia bacterium]
MDNSLQGNLGHFSLHDVLRFLADGGRTGTMKLTSGGREAIAWLDGGAIVFAWSNQEQMRMPLVLARRGKLTKDQRARLEELAKQEGERFAQAAIKQGVFKADQLRDLSAEYVAEVMIDALLWDGGSFGFSVELALPDSAVPVLLKVDDLLERGAKREAEWAECRKLFPNPAQAFQVMGDPEADEKITLSVTQFKTLLKIKELGAASVEQLCLMLDRDPLETYRTMDGLRTAGLIVESSAPVAVATAPAVRPVPPPPAPAPPVVAAPPPPPPAPELESEDDVPTAVADWRDQVAHPAPDAAGIPEPEPTVATPLASFRPAPEPSIESLIGVLTLDNADKTSFPLFETEHSVGREANNSIQVPDSSVSGAHARIRKTPEGYLLEDLNSRNGTYVNGERIQTRLLRNDDKIRLGKVHMVFNLPTQMQPPKTTAPGD